MRAALVRARLENMFGEEGRWRADAGGSSRWVELVVVRFFPGSATPR